MATDATHYITLHYITLHYTTFVELAHTSERPPGCAALDLPWLPVTLSGLTAASVLLPQY